MKFLVPVIVLLLATHAHALITCEDLYNQGDATDGVKVLETPAGEPFEGYCLQSENGGGWLLVGKQENFASGGWTSYSAANVLLNQTVLQNLDSGTSGTSSILDYNTPGAIMYVVDDANKPNNWVMTGGFDDYSIASGRYCWKSDYQNNIDLLTTSDGFPYSLWYPLNIVLYSSSGTSGVMFGSTVRFLQVAPQCHEIHCNDASQRHGRYNGVCQNGNAGVGSWFVFTRGSIPPDTPTPQLSVSPSSDPSNAATLTLTINFLQTVTGFVVGDIVTTNAVASNLQGGTNGLYTATLTPTAGIDDTVTVDVPVNVVTEGNEAATQLSFRHDSLLPTATFVIGDQATSPIPISVAWSEDVTSFDINSVSVPADVTVGSFNAVNATHYTFTVAPSTTDAFSVVIPAGEALDHVSNPNAQQSSASISFACDVGSLGNTTDNEPTLDTTASGIYNDEVKVIFTESVKYENTQFFFGSSSCGVNHFTWQESSVDSGTCETTWTGTATWADFTANCDLIRTESAIESVDHIIYQANFHITHTETFDGLRPGDDPITRTITQYMPFEVRLPTSVTATTSPVRIFAPVVVEAAILEQGVSGTPGGDMTGRVGFLTSVQYPFRLGSVTAVTTPAGVATSDADPSVWVGHGEVGTCNDDSAAPCTQFFEWSFSPASGAICELDGEYNVTLEVECQASQVNDCPLDPNPGSVTLSFTLDTTDFCVELVDDLSVSASLETYLSDSFLVVKHDFIDGQRIYAQAPTQAEVSLSSTKVVQVSLVKPDASEIFFLNQGSPALTTEGTQVDLVTVDGAAVGPAQNSPPSFNFLADSELFGIAADQSDFITLKARVELSYDNAGQAKRSSHDAEWTVLATTSSGTVATSFAMSGSNAVATQGTGTSASTTPAAAATIAGVNILFMGAALVVMCTVLIAAVVISRGRAKIDALREQLATKVQM